VRVLRRSGWSLPEREATPEAIFLSRRDLLKRSLAASAGMALLGPAAAGLARGAPAAEPARARYPARRNADLSVDLPLTEEGVAAAFNNFYEFGPDKEIAARAQALTIDPWTLEIGGLVERPQKLGVEDLLRRFDLEERVYRFRCVEAWAMVVPWTGLPLARLLEWVKPLPEARHVRFETFYRPREALFQLVGFWHPWPYSEGLRLDEARNELAMLVTGVYGKPLPKQHGAPIRLIVPWKYGFKSIKSIVKIELTREQPATFWNTLQPDEYDFLANVNPDVPHPRWSQATERLLGSDERQPTLLYNGYDRWVAHLYPRGARSLTQG
jgi:sulfoxide reductase catalytic subunit YedY